MKLYATSEFISKTLHLKKIKKEKSHTIKIKLYTTSKFLSNDISFEKSSHYHKSLSVNS